MPTKHISSVVSTGEGGQINLNLVAIRLMPTKHFSPVVSTGEGGQINLKIVAIRLMPTMRFNQQTESCLFKPIFILSSST